MTTEFSNPRQLVGSDVEGQHAYPSTIPVMGGDTIETRPGEILIIQKGLMSIRTGCRFGLPVELGLVGSEVVLAPDKFARFTPGFQLVAVTDLVLLRFSEGAATQFGLRDPQIERVVEDYLSALATETLAVSTCSLQVKVRRWLALAAERLKSQAVTVNQHVIADSLAASRPSVNVALRQLEEAGTIELRRGGVRLLLSPDELAPPSTKSVGIPPQITPRGGPGSFGSGADG